MVGRPPEEEDGTRPARIVPTVLAQTTPFLQSQTAVSCVPTLYSGYKDTAARRQRPAEGSDYVNAAMQYTL
jgi:hypothetical protein